MSKRNSRFNINSSMKLLYQKGEKKIQIKKKTKYIKSK